MSNESGSNETSSSESSEATRATRLIFDSPTEFARQLPRQGALLGVDFGTRRIGVAVSTRERSIALACCVLQRRSAEDCHRLWQLFEQRDGCAWVLGLPLSQSGKESALSRRVREFAVQLLQERETAVPLLLFDERFTSALVERAMRTEAAMRAKTMRKHERDSAAATVLLQNCLDLLGRVVD